MRLVLQCYGAKQTIPICSRLILGVNQKRRATNLFGDVHASPDGLHKEFSSQSLTLKCQIDCQSPQAETAQRIVITTC